jgi:hypothetical protein
MIVHNFSVLCSRKIIDHETNSISLIDIVEEFTIQSPLPPMPEGQGSALILPTPLNLFTLWTREPDDRPTKGQGRVCLLTPHQDAPKQISVYEIDLSDKLRMRAYGTIPGIPFRGPGTYRFIVQLRDEGEEEWKDVALAPLRIVTQATEKNVLPEAEKETPP